MAPVKKTAKWAGTCCACGKRFEAGTLVYWHKDKRLWHADCYEQGNEEMAKTRNRRTKEQELKDRERIYALLTARKRSIGSLSDELEMQTSHVRHSLNKLVGEGRVKLERVNGVDAYSIKKYDPVYTGCVGDGQSIKHYCPHTHHKNHPEALACGLAMAQYGNEWGDCLVGLSDYTAKHLENRDAWIPDTWDWSRVAELAGESEKQEKPESKQDEQEKPVAVTSDVAEKLSVLSELFGTKVDTGALLAAARKEAQDVAEKMLADVKGVVTKTIEFPQLDKVLEAKEGDIQHPEYERLAKWIAGGLIKRIWITGEAGTGKTHAVEQIAKALDRPLKICTPVVDKYELMGYADANGNYVATQLYEWTQTPGAILLLDESDGNFPAAMVAINAALANGYCVFPVHGKVKIPDDNLVIATANTSGEGATIRYNARMAQDGAFLDRFSAHLHWTLTPEFERAVCEKQVPYASTAKAVKESQRIRANLTSAGIDTEWGLRRTSAMAALVASGESIRDAALYAGLSKLDEHGRNRALEGVSNA